MQVPYTEYKQWTRKAEDWQTLEKLINKNFQQLREEQKPQIDYETHPKLTKALYKNIHDKINATIRFQFMCQLSETTKEQGRKLAK